jgi:hypothetical protein
VTSTKVVRSGRCSAHTLATPAYIREPRYARYRSFLQPGKQQAGRRAASGRVRERSSQQADRGAVTVLFGKTRQHTVPGSI